MATWRHVSRGMSLSYIVKDISLSDQGFSEKHPIPKHGAMLPITNHGGCSAMFQIPGKDTP
jgi:hypothetical protein